MKERKGEGELQLYNMSSRYTHRFTTKKLTGMHITYMMYKEGTTLVIKIHLFFTRRPCT